jgi:hypothetical protein
MKNRITDLMAQSMKQISHAIDNEDVEREKQSWMSFFEVLRVFSPEQIEEGMGVAFGKYSNIQVIALFLERLSKLGFDESDDPIINAVCQAAWKAFFRHASPELRQTLREGFRRFFPELKPVGSNLEGELLYSASDLAKVVGEDEVRSYMENRNLS